MINIVTSANDFHASLRYRMRVLQESLLTSGTECRISTHFLIDAETCVYSKHFNLADYPDACGAKGMGKKIVFDLCDLHHETIHAPHYQRMVDVADIITCNSREMKKSILEVYKRKAILIGDPILQEPIDRTPDLSKWLWFGHPANLSELEKTLPLIAGKDLEVCTVPQGPIVRKGTTTVTPWTPDAQQEAFRRSGVAFIPYGEGRQRAKSANRVLEALNASLVVCCINPITAVTDELLPFVETRVEDVSERSIKKMELGRRYARTYYSKEQMGKKWRAALCE